MLQVVLKDSVPVMLVKAVLVLLEQRFVTNHSVALLFQSILS